MVLDDDVDVVQEVEREEGGMGIDREDHLIAKVEQNEEGLDDEKRMLLERLRY